jgi:hypothetical protein
MITEAHTVTIGVPAYQDLADQGILRLLTLPFLKSSGRIGNSEIQAAGGDLAYDSHNEVDSDSARQNGNPG